VGVPTVKDVNDAMARPGRDPREDLPPPVFKKGILKLEDLKPEMELKGTILNVVDFGAFIDVGLKDSGLVHISQMANHYVRNPYDLVSVGDVVTVWVLSVDSARRRVSLTMKRPGSQRRPPEKKREPERSQPGDRPPQGRRPLRGRPATAPQQGQAAPEAQGPAAPRAPSRGKPPHRGRAPAAADRPAPPRQRKGKPLPKPKLSQAALQGVAPLRSFGELGAFFEAQERTQRPAPATPSEPAPEPPQSSEVPST
jgi:uncharacterized protein